MVRSLVGIYLAFLVRATVGKLTMHMNDMIGSAKHRAHGSCETPIIDKA